MQLSKQLADLVEVIRLVLERFGDDALRGGSSLRFERQGPVWGNFDVSRVDQVFTNLLSNAIRYGRGKPIVVGAVGTGENARFWVEDRGIGIPPEHLDRIFQQYERAAPSTQLRGSRAGPVDLAAARGGDGGNDLCAQPGGCGIHVYSRDTEERMTGNILVVDDDTDLRETLQVLLDDSGYGVTAVASGKAALEKLKTGSGRPSSCWTS